MAFTFNDVQNLGSVKATETKASAKKTFGAVTDSVKETSSKVATGVKGAMPVSNNKFGNLVTQVNENYNELDERVWNLEFQMQMVAEWNNKVLPDEEAMKDVRRQWEEQQAEEARLAAEAEAKQEEEKATEPETLADALNDPKVLARLKALLLGTKEEVKAEVKSEPAVADEYTEGPVEEPDVPEQKEKAEGEWKQCIVCNTDISVVYKPDTCPHCKRTAEAEAAKKTGSQPRPRIRFDS